MTVSFLVDMPRALIHLHPQGAYLGRAIDYLSNLDSTWELYPSNFPTFIDQYNVHFADFLRLRIDGHKSSSNRMINIYASYLNSYKTTLNDQSQVDSFASCYDQYLNDHKQYIKKSVVDTISRGLLFPSTKYFNGDQSQRLSIENQITKIHNKIYVASLRVLLLSRADLLVISHMNYIYYTAPALAAESLGIPILLCHGGYNETIYFANSVSSYCSPAEIRKQVFDFNSFTINKQNCSSQITTNALRPASSTISQISHGLVRLQAQTSLNPNKRLAFVNHQIISEICYHFHPEWETESVITRYDLLKFTLQVLVSNGVNTYLRLHPDTASYPGERKVVDTLLNELQTNQITLLVDKDPTQIYNISNTSLLFPEIYSMGGNATCELLAYGVEAYSIGTCGLPMSCNRFTLSKLQEMKSFLDNPLQMFNGPPSLKLQDEAAKYIRFSRYSILRTTTHNTNLEMFDKLYHFGKVKDNSYTLSKFLDDALALSLSSDSLVLSSPNKDAYMSFALN